MLDDLKVSIVMPVYNGGSYFELALQSALAQTYRNIEIVIVNDGSTDGGATDAVARRYAEWRPDKVRYFHQANTGVAGALNKAVAEMTGDIFCWLSHDDLYAPEKTTVQVGFWKQLGRPDAMLISNYTLIDSEGKQFADVQFDHEQFKRSPMLPLFRGAVNGCTVFIPIGLLRAIPGPFDLSRRFTQDFQLWRRLIRETDFFHVPQSLVHYRVHSSQDSQRPDIADEGETLWRAMVEATTEVERAQMYGSSWRFYEETRKILAPTSYVDMVRHLEERRDTCISEELVSVVIPFFNEVELVQRAAESVLVQTHRRLELILVDDGSTEDVSPLIEMARGDPRMQLVRQANAGPGAARNTGLRRANGAYIAFLDGDDEWLPHKVETQLDAMQKAGVLFSHTSYFIAYPGEFDRLGWFNSGTFTGNVYPEILVNCVIATPTVMFHRSLLAGGFQFPEAPQLGEDVLTWIEVAKEMSILGIETPLSVVEWADTSAAIDLRKARAGLTNLLSSLERDAFHARRVSELARLRASRDSVAARIEIGAPRQIEAGLVEYVFCNPTIQDCRACILEAATHLESRGDRRAAAALESLALKIKRPDPVPLESC